MSRFRPVHLPEDRQLNGRASQTFLRHYQACPRSGFLYALHRGEARTREMMRGSALHAILERSTAAALEQGEAIIPAEIVKVIVNEVLADPEFPVPFEEHDYIREAAYRWGEQTAVDPPESVVAVETLFTMDVAGYQVRAKVDYAALSEGGAACMVKDYKSARAAPPYEEIARKRPDGMLLAKSFQLILYALELAFGVPVRVEPCKCADLPPLRFVEGIEVEDLDAGPGAIVLTPEPVEVTCTLCEGRGYIETPEPFPLAGRANRFDLEYVYPGIEDRDGKIVTRKLSLTRAELDEYRLSLEGLLARVADSEESGNWLAVVSDAACSECPAASQCPIPAELRDHRGTVNTVEEAAEAFECLQREKATIGARGKELRLFVKRFGPVRFGGGMVAEIGYTTSERIDDKEEMFAAQERAVLYGEPFARHRYVKTVESFPLVVRALTAEELAESEDSNGQDGDGGRDGGDGLDERFGADAPY